MNIERRLCSQCATRHTQQWRRGKNGCWLCNTCGMRERNANRAKEACKNVSIPVKYGYDFSFDDTISMDESLDLIYTSYMELSKNDVM